MSSPAERFFAAQDDSGHWYVVPVAIRAEWDAWVQIPSDDDRAWTPPAGVRDIDGPHLLTFTDPQ
jgi:hypothetical protein